MFFDELHDRLTLWLARDTDACQIPLLGPLEKIKGGWAVTDLYTATLSLGGTSSAAAASTVVVKLYSADASGVAHATREFRALTHLAAVGYPVPTVVFFEPDLRPIDRPFLVMDHIEGASFWAAFEAADRDAQVQLVQSFTERLLRLHATDPRRLETTAEQMHPYSAIDAELFGLRRDTDAAEHGALSEVVLWLNERRDAVPCPRPVILHRDYHPWNVVVDAAERLWVLDWDWQIGDPRFDLAWTCTLMQRSGHAEFSDSIKAEFARQTALPVNEYDYFEVLTTTRWLMNVLPALGERSQLRPAKRDAFRTFLREPVQRARRLLQRHTGISVDLANRA